MSCRPARIPPKADFNAPVCCTCIHCAVCWWAKHLQRHTRCGAGRFQGPAPAAQAVMQLPSQQEECRQHQCPGAARGCWGAPGPPQRPAWTAGPCWPPGCPRRCTCHPCERQSGTPACLLHLGAANQTPEGQPGETQRVTHAAAAVGLRAASISATAQQQALSRRRAPPA